MQERATGQTQTQGAAFQPCDFLLTTEPNRPVPVVQMPLLVCIHWSTTAQINPVLYLAEFLISFYTDFVYTLIFGDLVLLI